MTLKNRYDFVYLFDVTDGNPNGDPDAGNLPRIDAETGEGLVTDVCLKRKVRNYVMMTRKEEFPWRIYVKEKAILNELHELPYKEIAGLSEEAGGKKSRGGAAVDKARRWMCDNFFDIRTFGAVMTTGDKNCGQVRGPIQLTFSRSVSPVVTLEHTITRMAVTSKEESDKQEGENRTMGRKFTVPYGLYRCHGFVSANLAEGTGFGEADLELFWEALANMFESDRSAARGMMVPRGLYVFKHDSSLGNAPAHKLFDLITVRRKGEGKPERAFGDFEVRVDSGGVPKGVTLDRRIG